MIHIIIDSKSNKGLVNISGDHNEIRNEFANFFERLYEASPDMFLEMVNVLTQFTNHLKEELIKNDQNNSSNESDQ